MMLDPTTLCAARCNQVTNRSADPLVANRIGNLQGNSTARGLCGPRRKPLDAGHRLRARTQCDRCESSTFIETPIHAGESLRRVCAIRHHFQGWPVWYGRNLEGNQNHEGFHFTGLPRLVTGAAQRRTAATRIELPGRSPARKDAAGDRVGQPT